MGTDTKEMVRLGGLEPPTPWFEATCSIQLSYSRLKVGRYFSLQR